MMKNKLMIMSGVLLAVILIVSMANAEGELSGSLFGDYAWIAQSNKADLDGKSGFVFRRIYATYDNALDEDFSTRVRFEMVQKNFSAATGKMIPFVKDAYLKYKFGNHNLYAGMSGTPTWGFVEKIWGYRWLEKTPLDLHKLGGASSRDIGLALKGHFDQEQKIGYHFMLGQGASTSSESDKGKKYYGSLLYNVTNKLGIEAYGDYEDSEGDLPHTASYTLQAFAGYKGDFGRIGAMFVFNSTEPGIADSTVDVSIISGFIIWKLSDKIKGIARADYLFDPNENAADASYLPMVTTAKSTLFLLLGFDYQAAPNVFIQPNIEIVSYGDDVNAAVAKSDGELVPRVSIFYKF